MTRLLPFIAKPIAALIIFVSLLGPLFAYAESDPNSPLAPGESIPTENKSSYNIPQESTYNSKTITAPSTITPALQNTQTKGSDLQCSVADGMGLAICVSGFVYYITVGLGSWVAGITAYVFDYAVQLSLVSGAYAFDFINIGWGIVRDVANMSFLFILIYIAFKIMFQAETAGTMRMLVWVVVIALLVNFSFLMTRLVIDAGNIVALQFYNAIAPPGSPTIQNPSGQATNNTKTGGTGTADITTTIMNALNPQGIMGTDGFKNVVQQPSAMYYLIVASLVYILTGVSLFMLAAVFIFAAVRFIMRVIGLWFVIIVAPAAFVAAIFRGKEGGAKWFNKWLGYLLEFSFYPAVFLFMFYIEVRFLQEMNSTALFNDLYNATASANSSWTSIAQAAASVGIRLGFIISTMYLILRSSQWAGQAFNTTAMKWADRGLVSLGRGTLKLGTQSVLGGARLATQPIRSGIQSQANVATRTGVNSTLWRNINRAVGGTNQARPSQLTLAGLRGQATDAQATAQQSAARREAAQGASANARVEPKLPDYTGAAPEPRVSLPGSRDQFNLPNGPRRIEPVIPMGRAPEVSVGGRNTQGVINQVAAESTSRHAQPSSLNVAAQRAIENLKASTEKAKETARAGSVAITLTTTPDLTRSTNTKIQEETKTSAPIENRQQVQAEEIKEGIKGLGQTVSAAIAAAKNGTAQPTVVISTPAHTGPTTIAHIAAGSAHLSDGDIDKLKGAVKGAVRKELEHFEPSAPHEPIPPTPAAPAAKPAPQANNDDYPYSQAAE